MTRDQQKRLNWARVPGWDEYEVSDCGRVRVASRRVLTKAGGTREATAKELKPWVNHRGYQMVTFWRDAKRKHQAVHRLVLLAFVGPCPEGMEGCHNNGNPGDCKLSNLRWGTAKENHADKIAHGTWQGGERCGRHKLTEQQVVAIRASGDGPAKVGAQFGISPSTVHQIRQRRTWRHI